MDSNISLLAAYISLCAVCFVSIQFIKTSEQDKPAKILFSLYYVVTFIGGFLLTKVDENSPSAVTHVIDISATLYASLIALALAVRNRHKQLIRTIIVIAVLYHVASMTIPFHVSYFYLFDAIMMAIAVYTVVFRRPRRNKADYGLMIILTAWLLLSLSTAFLLPWELNRQEFFETYFESTLVPYPAVMTGITLFLISSYMLDSHKKLENLATYDSMTKLLNRRSVTEQIATHLKRMKRHGGSASFVIADIDKFKLVNDNYGHNVGDEAIVHFAQIIKKSLRDIDLAARYGGEEFLLFLPETTAENAKIVAERIRAELKANPLQSSKGELPFTASFGIQQAETKETIQANIEKADKALYQAKENGRDRVVLHIDL